MRSRRSSARCFVLGLFASLPLLSCGEATSAPPRNAVLLTVDTLRADRIGAYGYRDASTPNLDALAGESIRFERAYAHASATLPSVASLLTGELPARHGVLGNRGAVAADVATLAERLTAHGFESAAFVGNFVLRRGRGVDRSFGAYTERFLAREAVRGNPENPAELLTDQAIAWLGERDPARRFFLWVHYQEPHGPYTPPRFDAATGGPELPRSETNSGRRAIPRYQWLGHGRLAEYLARYDGEVAEVDRHAGRLLDALRSAGLLDQSVLVFTADHGEAFGEDDLYLCHGDGLGEVLLRVPLLLRLPSGRPALRADRVRLIDVAPTILSLLGIEAPGLPGSSLLEDAGDRLLAAELEPISGPERWRLVRRGSLELSQAHPAPPVLRDLARGDGAPAAAGADAERAALDRELEALAPFSTRPAAPLSASEREELRALGYVD